MPTNLNIDDTLLNQAKRLGKHKTKRDAVDAALKEYIRQRHSKKLFALMGTMQEFDQFDARAARGKRESTHRHNSMVANAPTAKPRRETGSTRRAA